MQTFTVGFFNENIWTYLLLEIVTLSLLIWKYPSFNFVSQLSLFKYFNFHFARFSPNFWTLVPGNNSSCLFCKEGWIMTSKWKTQRDFYILGLCHKHFYYFSLYQTIPYRTGFYSDTLKFPKALIAFLSARRIYAFPPQKCSMYSFKLQDKKKNNTVGA